MPWRVIIALLAALASSPALAQNPHPPVTQSGTVTPGHVPAWITTGVIGDSGAAQASKLSSIGTTGQGSTICANSGPITGPFNQLCLGVNLNSAAQIILQNFGGAPAEQLQFIINGTTFTVPFGGAGTPGGSNTQVQYNNAGVFGGISGVTSNGNAIVFASNALQIQGSGSGITSIASTNSSSTNFTLQLPSATANLTYQVAAFISGDCLQASGTAGGIIDSGSTNCGGGGGGGSPGGSNTQLQRNNAGSFGGITGATSNGTTVVFANSDLILGGTSTGTTTFSSNNSGASNFTMTFPAVTDFVVVRSSTDTLTNKTLTSSTNVLGGVTVTVGSDATGDIYYRNSGGVLTRLGIGSTGQVLNVTGGLPAWTNVVVTSVTNSDLTLTILPTTGNVVASLNLGNANTWTGAQTFTNSDIKLLGSSTGATTFTSANSTATNFTLTFPAITDTITTNIPTRFLYASVMLAGYGGI